MAEPARGTAEAGRRARRGQVAAHLVGAGAARDRREAGRDLAARRRRGDRSGPRPASTSAPPTPRATASSRCSAHRFPDDWAEIGGLNVGATLPLGIPTSAARPTSGSVRLHRRVDDEPVGDADLRRTLPVGEAKYNGSNLAVIDPIYSATAMPMPTSGCRSSQHRRRPRPRHRAPHLGERPHRPAIASASRPTCRCSSASTPLPRESDLPGRGRDDLFYVWDPKRGSAVAAPGSPGNDDQPKLVMDGLEPPIEGSFR